MPGGTLEGPDQQPERDRDGADGLRGAAGEDEARDPVRGTLGGHDRHVATERQADQHRPAGGRLGLDRVHHGGARGRGLNGSPARTPCPGRSSAMHR
jgi:hypothetical protein